MKIIAKQEAYFVTKPEGTKVWYYLRPEYEIHFNEQIPGSTQQWHHHEKICETLFILEGELTAQWKEDNQTKSQIVKSGDMIETQNSPHTFTNHTGKVVKFIVLKFVPTGQNKHELIKNDKIVDE